MKARFAFILLMIILCMTNITHAAPVPPAEVICGRWESTDNSLIVDVYTDGNIYKAKIVWFKNTDGKPMDYWTDRHNPNKALRGRKILGLNVLSNLSYKSNSNSWEDGMVYDSTSGREWNASANIDKSGLLKVRGYWHFKFIGKTMTFRRA